MKSQNANSTFAIGEVSCSAESLMISESFLLSINICGKYPAHRKSANFSRNAMAQYKL